MGIQEQPSHDPKPKLTKTDKGSEDLYYIISYVSGYERRFDVALTSLGQFADLLSSGPFGEAHRRNRKITFRNLSKFRGFRPHQN